MKASFTDRFGTYIILVVVVLVVVGMWYLGVFSSAKPCGFIPAAVGKTWKCRCLGAMDIVQVDNGVRYYCTGLNFSNNKAVEWLEGEEMPVWEEEVE